MTRSVATQVVMTVNAPYGTNFDAHQLAEMIADTASVTQIIAPVFAFFSEVPVTVQRKFIAEMGVDAVKASQLADQLSKLAGFTLPLATDAGAKRPA